MAIKRPRSPRPSLAFRKRARRIPSVTLGKSAAGRSRGKERAIKRQAARPIGKLTRKMALHPAQDIRNPPMVGPREEPRVAAAVTMPRACPRWSFGKAPMTMEDIRAVMQTAPAPCTRRKAISQRIPGASPQSRDPVANSTRPKRKTRFWPKRRAIAATGRRKTTMTSR